MRNKKSHSERSANFGAACPPKLSSGNFGAACPPKLPSGNFGAALTEGLIAVSIIATAVVGILGLLAVSLRHAQISRSQLIASQLAIEGIEVVRSIRDENWIEGEPWDTGLIPDAYLVEYDSRGLMPFTDDIPLRLNRETGRYQYDVGDRTEFTRRIIIYRISADQIRVTSNVSWHVRGVPTPFEINTEEHLFNFLR